METGQPIADRPGMKWAILHGWAADNAQAQQFMRT